MRDRAQAQQGREMAQRNNSHAAATCNNNFYQEQKPGEAGRMQGVIATDAREAPVPAQHRSLQDETMQEPGHEHCIPKGATPLVSSTTTGTTLAGTFTTSRFVKLEKILLPEFHRSCRIDSHTCYLIKSKCPYDIIVGRDLLTKIRMGFDFSKMTLTAYSKTVGMKPKHFYQSPFTALLDIV
jgi:hypothetical protein